MLMEASVMANSRGLLGCPGSVLQAEVSGGTGMSKEVKQLAHNFGV